MKYISLDTCVWLALIKDEHKDDNVFEELCYLIEGRHLIHITPQNVISEWDRNKEKESVRHIDGLHDSYKKAITGLTRAPDALAIYNPETTKKTINNRVARIDTILRTYSEVAPQNDTIILEASKRSLGCLAPCHIKDSYRDSVNIVTLVHYLKIKGYTDCVYSTINAEDFSADKKGNRHELHAHLVPIFKDANLRFIYCDEAPFAAKLMNVLRKEWGLDGFQSFLKEKIKKEKESILAEKKEMLAELDVSKEYLDNIAYIDLILSKKERTAFDEEILELLFKKHPQYSDYFLQKVTP